MNATIGSTTLTPQNATQRANPTWHAFSADHDQDDARRVFAPRYGVPPVLVFASLGILLAGPVPALEV